LKYLTRRQVLTIHQRAIERFGGTLGIRDEHLLDSAIQRPRATFEQKDLYPDLFTKAAALGHSLILNHPFIDGNKRTAYQSMRAFLKINGADVTAAADEIVAFALDIEAKNLEVEDIANWLRAHVKKLGGESDRR